MTTPTIKDDAGQLCVPCFIDGEPIIQPSAASFPVVSSKEQKAIHYGQTASTEIAVRAVDSAALAFKTLKKTGAAERQKMLLAAADMLEARAQEMMHRQMSETSCDDAWARFNAFFGAALVRGMAASLISALACENPPASDGVLQIVQKEPVGPVLAITPWNGAVALCVRSVASALAAGCPIVLKVSELCPWTQMLVAEIFLKAGFPPGSVNVIMAERSAGPAVTEAVIAHPSLRKVEFIGSTAVGKAVGVICAKHLKPIIMELGDQSPAIVLDDAKLKDAARAITESALRMHGQVCFSLERVIVQRPVYDEFCELLKEAFKELPISGYAVSNASAEKGKALVDEAVQRGATLLYGKGELTGPAALGPTILTNVDRESTISKNESFAPVLFMDVIDTDEEAIAEANSREGGLTASVFTASQERGLKMANELEFGGVSVNTATHLAPYGPMPGWKASGWGSNAGRYGIEAFLQHRVIVIHTGGK